MGMLMHYTLIELEESGSKKRKVEKPVENPINEEPEAEQKKATGRRKSSK